MSRTWRIRDFNVSWGEALQPCFSDGVECEYFDGVEIAGFEGRQQGAGSAAINLHDGRGARIRDSVAAPGTSVFLRFAGLARKEALARWVQFQVIR